MKHTHALSRILFLVTVIIMASFLVFQLNSIGESGDKGHTIKVPAAVAQTGQTKSYANGDDSDLDKGMVWPDPRFSDNGDGTVTDLLTGLIWLKDANCIMTKYPEFDTDDEKDGRVTWKHGLKFIAGINDGTYMNCGVGYSDWRFPNVRELHSLINYGNYSPALSDCTNTIDSNYDCIPFVNVRSGYYWTSSSHQYFNDNAVTVDFNDGGVWYEEKSYFVGHPVWPVRGGN